MLSKFFAWYGSTPLMQRRIFILILVPVHEYLFLEPARRALNVIAKSSPHIAIGLLPVLLLLGISTAAVIGLFVYEFWAGIGSKIKSKTAGLALLVFVFGWVILPLHLITLSSQ